MKFDPRRHHRRSIRLKGYDYSRTGLYFITICVQERLHLFGEIQNGEMMLNNAGHIIERWYHELGNKYPDKHCHEMVVMPNHFHCIIENRPDDHDVNAHVGTSLRGRLDETGGRPYKTDGHQINNTYGPENKIFGATVGNAIGWFKTMTTNEYIRGVKSLNWPPFNKKLWQRNYYEHIIRNEKSHWRISEYFINNPAKWAEDKFHS